MNKAKPTIQIRAKGKHLKLLPAAEVEAPAPVTEPTAADEAKKKPSLPANLKIFQHWPEMFDLENPKPLPVGIVIMLVNDAAAKNLPVTAKAISSGIKKYISRPEYHAAVIAGDVRYALDGTTTPITEAQRNYARNELAKLTLSPDEYQERAREKKRAARRRHRANRKAREQQAAIDSILEHHSDTLKALADR